MKKPIFLRSALSALLLSVLFGAATAEAKPTTAVVLGDSFSSGEGGRWRGNTVEDPIEGRFDGYAGTDAAGFTLIPAPLNPTADWDKVYEENSIDNGCHRAYSAAIHQLKQPYFPLPPMMLEGPLHETVNLSCSGARNKHLWPIDNGGEIFKGEVPQITQLGELASTHDIKLIVLGIGGNDMGFSDVIINCALAWAKKHFSIIDNAVCHDFIEREILPKLGDVYFKTAKTIDLIREEMQRHGKADPDDYRIVLTGYPAILAGFSDFRFPAGSRRIPGHCPFNGPDAQYIEQVLMPKLNGVYEALAHQESVDFINTKDVFEGHKLCQTGPTRASTSGEATAGNMEWVRYIDHAMNGFDGIETAVHGIFYDSPVNGQQGRIQESLHPNQFGQEAIGSCIRKWWLQRESVPGPYKCTNSNLNSTKEMQITKLPAPTFREITADAVIPDAYQTGEGIGGIHEYEPGELLRSAVFSGEQSEPADMARIELKIDHPSRSDLAIFLHSPSGVVHQLRHPTFYDIGPFLPVQLNFLTSAPWEPGLWTLKIQDTRQPGVAGTFRDFKIWWF